MVVPAVVVLVIVICRDIWGRAVALDIWGVKARSYESSEKIGGLAVAGEESDELAWVKSDSEESEGRRWETCE